MTPIKYLKGFTLIEVMIASIVLFISVSAGAVLIARATAQSTEMILTQKSFQVMEAELENVRYTYTKYDSLYALVASPLSPWVASGTNRICQNIQTVNLYKPTLSDSLTGQLSVCLTRVVYTYNSVSIPALELKTKVTHLAGTDSLETILTDVPVP